MSTAVHCFTFALGGGHELAARTWMCLLSAMAWAPAGSRFSVLTDRPEDYRWFGDLVDTVHAAPAEIDAWHGPHRFFWRVKMMTVLELARRHPTLHPLYLDTDTLVRRPLDGLAQALAAGDTLMHEREYDLAATSRKGQRRLWRMVRGTTPDGLAVEAPCAMWNAGVVAVGAGRIDILERAVRVCDALLASSGVHTLTEQFSFSLALGAGGRLRPADAWIDHYWSNKPGFDRAIDRELAAILIRGGGPETALPRIREHPITLPLQVRRRWWSKLLIRLAGHAP